MAENGETDAMDPVVVKEEEKTKEEPEKEKKEEEKEKESTEETPEVEHTEDYQKLIDYGINAKVATELDKIYKSGLLSHTDLDERALDALKEFPPDGGVAVLKQFAESNLEHVGNKSAYLCGVMKTYRQKNKMPGGADGAIGPKKGPDEAKLKEILERTGYSLDVTTGQRKYGGPPPDWDTNVQPGAGHEVFAGKIPKDIFEDELIPLFEKCGTIWDLRLMMDPMTGLNRGFCFVTFTEKDGAHEGVRQLDNYEIRKGKHLKVNISVANLRLFVGNIPKSKSKQEIFEEFKKITEDGLTDVIIYSSPDDPKKKNRGFAFLEYDTHKSASLAKRRLSTGRIKVWGCDIIVDWADPIEEPDDDTMSKVKVLYVRNLKSDITEEQLKEKFEPFGKIERVKKIKDYGFIHFEERECAVKAMNELNGKALGETEMQISLAKPPSENRQKEKRKREQTQRMMMMGGRGYGLDYDDPYYAPPGPPGRMGPPPPPGRGRMMRPPPPGRGGFRGDYDYDYYGYGDYRGGYADPYYDDYYGGYDDYYEGYSSGYGPGPRGRGRGGPPPPPPPGRGRGGAPPRGGRGGATPAARGSRGARGMRGGMARGGNSGSRGGGGMAGGRGAQQRGGGKRKIGGDHSQGMTKKRNTDGNWGAQPIAQQPLNQSGGYDSQWYQDSYSQQWG